MFWFFWLWFCQAVNIKREGWREGFFVLQKSCFSKQSLHTTQKCYRMVDPGNVWSDLGVIGLRITNKNDVIEMLVHVHVCRRIWSSITKWTLESCFIHVHVSWATECTVYRHWINLCLVDIMVCFEFMFDHRSYTHNLSSCEIITWKKSGMGSNPVQVWFFQALISQLLKLWSSLYSSTWIVLLTVRYPLDSDLWVNCPAFEQPMLIVTIDTNTVHLEFLVLVLRSCTKMKERRRRMRLLILLRMKNWTFKTWKVSNIS